MTIPICNGVVPILRDTKDLSGLIIKAKIIPRKIDAAALPINKTRAKNNEKTIYIINNYLKKIRTP
jgi:hypothetical protein